GRSGNAPNPARSYTLPGMADALLEVLEMIGGRDIAIFGWSLGRHIALQMAPQLGADLKGLMITRTPPVSAANIMEGFLPSPHMLRAGVQHFCAEDVAAFGKAIIGEGVDPMICQAIARADGMMRKPLFDSVQDAPPIDQRWLAENLAVPLAIVNGGA